MIPQQFIMRCNPSGSPSLKWHLPHSVRRFVVWARSYTSVSF